MNKTVYIVHSIDTEGHLNEDLKATFIRLKDSFGLNLKPSYKTLIKLQNKSINLNGLENTVSKFVSSVQSATRGRRRSQPKRVSDQSNF